MFRFPPLGPPGRVPQLLRYYQNTTTSYCHLAALRFLRLAIPWLHSLCSLPGGRVRRQGLELVTRCLHPGIDQGTNRTLPSSWETSVIRLHMFQTDAGRTAHTRPFSAAAWPLVIKRQRLPRKVFRRSIAWLSDSLSTLRNADYSNTTQDSLPVAGQALLGGLSTRMVPLKGFRVVNYISSSFPKLAWRNGRVLSAQAVSFCVHTSTTPTQIADSRFRAAVKSPAARNRRLASAVF